MTILLQNVLQIQHNFYQALSCCFAERDKLNLKFISARDQKWPKQSWKRKELKNSGMPISKLMCIRAQSLSCIWLFANPWTVACQVLLSMRLSWQEHWSGLPFPPPVDLPNLGIKPASPAAPALAGGFFYHWTTWTHYKAKNSIVIAQR